MAVGADEYLLGALLTLLCMPYCPPRPQHGSEPADG